MSTTSCPTLPPEIWCHIASFITSTTLQQVQTVNRFLFDLAMNERYHTVRMQEINGNLEHIFLALRNPDTAKRVHSFYLDPGMATRNVLTDPKPDRINPFRRIIHAMKGPVDKKHLEEEHRKNPTIAEQLVPYLMDMVPLLVNIQAFELQWNLSENTPSPYLDLLWGCHGSRLTELRLTVTRPKMDLIVHAPPPSLPNLRLLHMRIDRFFMEWSNMSKFFPNILILLAKFVNNFHNTLEDLAVTCRPMLDMSSFYANLADFNKLKTINLDASVPLPPVERPTSLSKFVQQIASNLTALTISTSLPIAPTNSYQFSFDGLVLRNLRSLTISAEIMALSWDNTGRFLKIHSPFLQSLAITDPIAPAEVRMITLLIGRDTCAIKQLSIQIYLLEPRLLSLLCQGLQHLRSLELRVHKVYCAERLVVMPSATFPENYPSQFFYLQPLKKMISSTESLHTWQLQDLTLKRRSCCGDIILWGLLRVFAECIPSVKSFAGNGDLAEPDPANRRPVHGERTCLKDGKECMYGRDGDH